MSRDTRIAAACLAAIPILILGSSVAVTLAVAHGASPMWRAPFKLICHGIAHRCLLIDGAPMPVCARCVGIYAGFLLALMMFPLLSRTGERAAQVTLAVAAAAMLIDGLTQAAGLRESTNPLRLVTGVAAGAAFGWWMLISVETRARQQVTNS